MPQWGEQPGTGSVDLEAVTQAVAEAAASAAAAQVTADGAAVDAAAAAADATQALADAATAQGAAGDAGTSAAAAQGTADDAAADATNALGTAQAAQGTADGAAAGVVTNAAAITGKASQADFASHGSRHLTSPTLGADPLSLAGLGDALTVSRVSNLETMPRPMGGGVLTVTIVAGNVSTALAVAQASGNFTRLAFRQSAAAGGVTNVRGAVYDAATLALLAETADLAAAQGANVYHDAALLVPGTATPYTLAAIQGKGYYLGVAVHTVNMTISGLSMATTGIAELGSVLENRVVATITSLPPPTLSPVVSAVMTAVPWVYLKP